MMKMNNQYLVRKNISTIVLEKAYRLIYPNKCLFCRQILTNQNEVICIDCICSIHYVFDTGSDKFGIKNRYYAAFEYTEPVRQLIFRYKYEGKKMLASSMAKAIFQRFGALTADFIVPVPLHPKRINQRGYNQSLLLGLEISLLLNIPIYDCLQRVKNTQKQFGLKAEERILNMSGAFALKENFNVAGWDILLVDDILTTGATAAECFKVFETAGAKSVKLITFAASTLKTGVENSS